MDRFRPSGAWPLNTLLASCLVLILLGAACAPAPSAQRTDAATGAAGSAAASQPAAASAPAQLPAAQAATSAASASAPAQPAAKPEPVKVSVGYAGAVSDLPTFLAVERGYFSSQGLDVELIPFNAVAAMTAPLASG